MKKVACFSVVLAALALGCSSGISETSPDASPSPSPSTSPSTPEADSGVPPGKGVEDAGNSSDGPTAAVSGTASYSTNLTDFTISPKDVLARLRPPAASGTDFNSKLKLDIVDFAGACADRTNGVKRKGSKKIEIEIERAGATLAEAALVPGTYTIDVIGDGSGDVYLGRGTIDATCASSYTPPPFTIDAATVKQIVITKISSTHVTGTYELRAADGRYLKGAFDADFCPDNSSATSVCQ
jgi:hypothetical protein